MSQHHWTPIAVIYCSIIHSIIILYTHVATLYLSDHELHFIYINSTANGACAQSIALIILSLTCYMHIQYHKG